MNQSERRSPPPIISATERPRALATTPIVLPHISFPALQQPTNKLIFGSIINLYLFPPNLPNSHRRPNFTRPLSPPSSQSSDFLTDTNPSQITFAQNSSTSNLHHGFFRLQMVRSRSLLHASLHRPFVSGQLSASDRIASNPQSEHWWPCFGAPATTSMAGSMLAVLITDTFQPLGSMLPTRST